MLIASCMRTGGKRYRNIYMAATVLGKRATSDGSRSTELYAVFTHCTVALRWTHEPYRRLTVRWIIWGSGNSNRLKSAISRSVTLGSSTDVASLNKPVLSAVLPYMRCGHDEQFFVSVISGICREELAEISSTIEFTQVIKVSNNIMQPASD